MTLSCFSYVNLGKRVAWILKISVDSENSSLCDPVQADDEAVGLNKALMDKLLELDDVDAVFSNQK